MCMRKFQREIAELMKRGKVYAFDNNGLRFLGTLWVTDENFKGGHYRYAYRCLNCGCENSYSSPFTILKRVNHPNCQHCWRNPEGLKNEVGGNKDRFCYNWEWRYKHTDA